MVLFSVVMLSSVAELSDVSGRARQAIRLASVLSVAAAAFTELNSFTREALETLEQLSDYSRSLLLVMAATVSLSGAVSSAAAKCAATALVMDLLLTAGTGLISPAVCGYTALSIADAAVGNRVLKSASGLMKSVCTFTLTALATGFTLWLGFISSVSGSADAAGVKLTRSLLSNGLPVVLSLCLGSVIRLFCRYMAFRLTAGLCRCCSGGELSGFLEDLSSVYALLLSLVGTGAVCVFMAVWSLMRISV